MIFVNNVCTAANMVYTKQKLDAQVITDSVKLVFYVSFYINSVVSVCLDKILRLNPTMLEQSSAAFVDGADQDLTAQNPQSDL